MAYQTKQDILDKWETPESRQEAREIQAIKKDIATAQEAIQDALDRYRKAKLRAKSKKAAKEDPFAELEGYETREQIRDDYGWEIITEARMDRLMELWDLREAGGGQDEIYRDRVTEMLERAKRCVGDKFTEQLCDYARKVSLRGQEAEKVARENNERTWQREHGGA